MSYKNLEERRAYARKYYSRPIAKAKHIERSKKYYQNHKEQHLNVSRNRNRRLKIEAINRYGKICFCCNESIIEFLAIDHIDGNGNEQRRVTGCNGGVAFFRWLKKNSWPEGFQVACHNCNLGRHLNGGICPHQREIEEK